MDDSLIDDELETGSPDNQQELPDNGDDDVLGPSGADQTAGEPSTTSTEPPRRRDLNDLRNPLPFMDHMRQSLFHLHDPVELKESEFQLYWPYIDNVWVRQHKAAVDKNGKSNIDYYACRLQRPTYTPRRTSNPRPEGPPQRKKKTREGGTCQVRAKVTRHTGTSGKLTIARIGDQEHSHDLDHLDKIKRNSAVMDIARSEVMKGYMPASVFTVMHEEPHKLALIGGQHINRNDVRNASQHWRQGYKGELGVHPGYKYDLGNGISSATDPSPATISGFSGLTTTPLDPAISTASLFPPPIAPVQPPPPPQSVPGTHTSHLPPDTLYFPPPLPSFLAPYLPPTGSIPSGGLPHVTLTYATSLDSFLALSPTTPTQISSPATKSMTHYLRSRHNALLIGVGTAIADDPSLNCRLHGAGGYGGIGWQWHPRPIIIDPSARWEVSENSRILQAVRDGRAKGPWVIVAPGTSIDTERIELLKRYDGKYLGLPDFDARYRLDWEAILKALAQAGIRSVMVEGGGTVINELLRPENLRLVANVVVTVAPVYLGMGGVVVCPNRRFDEVGRPSPAVRFRDVRWVPVGGDVVMCGRVEKEVEGAGVGVGLGVGVGGGVGVGMGQGMREMVGVGGGGGGGGGSGVLAGGVGVSGGGVNENGLAMPLRGERDQNENGNGDGESEDAEAAGGDSVIGQLEEAAGLD